MRQEENLKPNPEENRNSTSKNKSKSKQKTALTTRPYVAVFYIFMCIFLALIAYLVYFQLAKSEELLSSQYNRRQDKKQESVIRGAILACDGTPLAYTEVDEEGNENRIYPYNNLFAQVVGYSDYGSSGLEAAENYVLLDSHTDLEEQMQNNMSSTKSQGDNVITSLNVPLQQVCYDALAGRKGAVIVMQADTAKTLACVSQPDFNPNTVNEDWEALNAEGSGSPFLNRALQGLYSPGSTFKLVTTLAYMRQYGTDFEYDCEGEYTVEGVTIHCADGNVHGHQNLTQALANSCNCAYAYMATKLFSESILFNTAESVKFNTEFHLELPSVISSFTLEKAGDNAITMQTAYGQGETLVSPVHMAMIAQAIYNDGVMLEPSFLLGIVNSTGTYGKEIGSDSFGSVMTQSEAQNLKQMMRAVVTDGTAQYLADLPYEICGKTGTAEYGSENGTNHNWFVGFSSTGNNDIVVAVIIEEAQPDDTPALQVARAVFENYMSWE